MNPSRFFRLRTLAVGISAFALAACSEDTRRNPGGTGSGGGAALKDSGVLPDTGINGNPIDTGFPVGHDTGLPINPDASTPFDSGFPPFDSGLPVGNDTGMQGCGSNPNNCVPHQIINTTDCSCLPFCEAGWTWNAGTGQCETGMMGRPDAGPYDGGVPRTDPFDVATLAAQYATASCQRQTRCEPAINSYFGQSEAQCITEQTRDITNYWSAVAQAIPQGRVGFNRTAFDACISAINSRDCINGFDVTDCTGIFTGAQAVGQPCSYSVECESTAYCGGVQGALNPLCGVCQARTASGGDCSATVCAAGNRCLDVQGQSLCIPNTAGAGQTCGTIQTGLCRGRLQCVGSTTFACMAPAGAGQTCDPQASTGPACNIYQNQVCVGTSCQTANWVGAGQSCMEPNLCNSATYCDDTSTNTCLAWPTAGQQCLMGECADGLFCDVATCAPLKTAGQSCQTSAECLDDLICLSNSCTQVSYTFCQ